MKFLLFAATLAIQFLVYFDITAHEHEVLILIITMDDADS